MPQPASNCSVHTPNRGRFYDILFSGPRPLLSPATEPLRSENAVLNLAGPKPNLLPEGFALQLVQDRADIDMSGPEFNFVRSIGVYDVLIDDDRDDGDCDRYARVRIGTYDTQGGFSWHQSNRSAIPTAFGRTSNGCSLFARAVFVEWLDYFGNYGFERCELEVGRRRERSRKCCMSWSSSSSVGRRSRSRLLPVIPSLSATFRAYSIACALSGKPQAGLAMENTAPRCER